jgi:hypothetical protein
MEAMAREWQARRTPEKTEMREEREAMNKNQMRAEINKACGWKQTTKE